MNAQTWEDVDRYLVRSTAAPDDVLDAVLETSRSAGLPPIAVAPNQGKLLHLLARMTGARRILEIGTLGGYSTIWLARALGRGGSLISLEIDPHHAFVARENCERAGVAGAVEIRVGAASESLAELRASGAGPFDFTFIDADKKNTAVYFDHAVALSRPGSAIVVDNVVREGQVVRTSGDESVRGVRAFFDSLARDARVDVTAVQTVGSKGYDGFALALVR